MQRGPYQRRPMQGGNPGPAQNRPYGNYAGAAQRRPMNRAEYEIMLRKRKQQNIIAIGALVLILALIVTAVILILSPGKPKDAAVSNVSAVVEQAPKADEVPVNEPAADQNADAGEPAAPAAPVVPVATAAPAAPANPEAAFRTGELRSVRMRVAGDIMVTMDQLKYAVAAGYSFYDQFALISDVLGNADYTMANMETTIGKYKDKQYSGYPLFNAPEQVLDPLRDAGVDFFTLANNHMLDRWFDGMKNTVDWMDKYGFGHVGAYRTKEERLTPVVKEVGGIKIGFLAYTHSTNTQEKVCDPAAVEYGVPYLNKSDFSGDVKRLRDAGAEVIIAFPHWGDEYVRTPDSNQQSYARKLANAGVDIILGSHSHMVQPMGYQNVTVDGKAKRVFTMFSLGNFISTHTVEYTDSGIILDFTINEQPDGTFTCDNVQYIPTYCWLHDNTVQVLPSGRYINNRPANMDSASYDKMVKSYNDMVDLIGAEFSVLGV